MQSKSNTKKGGILVKGILKKGLAVLKYGLAFLPYAVLAGGFLTFAGCGIASAVYEDKAKDVFTNSQAYIERKAEDLAYLEEAFANGEMSKEVYEKQKENIGSVDYIEGLLKLPQYHEYSEILKNSTNPYLIAILAGVGSMAVGLVSTLIYVSNDCTDDLMYSAEEDWRWAKEKKKKLEEESSTIEIKY